MTTRPELLNALELLRSYRRCGSEQTSTGVELICPTPHVGTHAWLHVIFPPLSTTRISEIEGALPFAAPASLHEFLATANGLHVFSGALSCFGQRKDYSRRVGEWEPFAIETPNTTERPTALPRGTIVFGAYDWDGSKLVATPSGSAERRSQDGAELLNRWDSIAHMLLHEVQRLTMLFDGLGRKLNHDEPTTPAPSL